MTFCASWKYKGHAFLIADTLRTKSVPSMVERTSFNEPQKQVGQFFVEESLLKLHVLAPGVACAFSGDVETACEAIDILRDQLSSLAATTGICAVSLALEVVIATLGPFQSNRRTVLLFACSVPGECIVGRWDTSTCRLEHGQDSYESGSLGEDHKELTRRMIRELSCADQEPKSVLLAAIATVQSYGLHDDLVADHVGGTIVGLMMFDGCEYWQEDTMYLIHRSTERGEGVVDVHFRNASLIINSSFTNRKGRVLLGFDLTVNNAEQVRDWEASTVLPFKSGEYSVNSCRNFILLDSSRRSAIVLITLNGVLDLQNVLSFKFGAKGSYSPEAKGVLVEWISRPIRWDYGGPWINLLVSKVMHSTLS